MHLADSLTTLDIKEIPLQQLGKKNKASLH